jgi:hypothetical protein
MLQRRRADRVYLTGVGARAQAYRYAPPDLLQSIVCVCTADGQIRSRWFTAVLFPITLLLSRRVGSGASANRTEHAHLARPDLVIDAKCGSNGAALCALSELQPGASRRFMLTAKCERADVGIGDDEAALPRSCAERPRGRCYVWLSAGRPLLRLLPHAQRPRAAAGPQASHLAL